MGSSHKHNLSNPNSWVDQYGQILFRYAVARLRDQSLAENVVQETFLAALKAQESFSGKSAEQTWLIGILKHKIIDHFRRFSKETLASEISDNQEAINAFFDHSNHMNKKPNEWLNQPNESVNRSEFWEAFYSCLKRLPTTTANVFVMREVDGLASKEICKELDISSTNLWVMLHRARLQLRECLENKWFAVG